MFLFLDLNLALSLVEYTNRSDDGTGEKNSNYLGEERAYQLNNVMFYKANLQLVARRVFL